MMKIIERRKTDRAIFYDIQPGLTQGIKNEFMSLHYENYMGEVKKIACIFFGEHHIEMKRDLLAKMLRKARNESK